MQTFTFKKIDFNDKAAMDKIYELRYQVYALECGFINPDDYPDNKESDEYDSQSVHFAAINQDGDVIGTMRMILQGDLPLPVEKHCEHITLNKNKSIPGVKVCEISRLVISKHLRRRRNDGMYYEPRVADKKGTDNEGNEFVRRCRPMAFGLYREMYLESKRLGLSHWYTIMEKSLWFLLRIHGFTFDAVGEEVDVYGPVRPYMGKIEVIEKEVMRKYPKFFEFLSTPEESSKLSINDVSNLR